jgi:5-methylcytosine-specific restriction protein B
MLEEIQSLREYFWAVGSSFGGTKDYTNFFLSKSIWEDGWGKSGDPVNKPTLDMIKKGDYLLMKSSSTKGTGHKVSFTKLKAVGKITGRVKHNYFTFLVDWNVINRDIFPKDFNGIWYSKTVEAMRNDEMLNFVKRLISH